MLLLIYREDNLISYVEVTPTSNAYNCNVRYSILEIVKQVGSQGTGNPPIRPSNINSLSSVTPPFVCFVVIVVVCSVSVVTAVSVVVSVVSVVSVVVSSSVASISAAVCITAVVSVLVSPVSSVVAPCGTVIVMWASRGDRSCRSLDPSLLLLGLPGLDLRTAWEGAPIKKE